MIRRPTAKRCAGGRQSGVIRDRKASEAERLNGVPIRRDSLALAAERPVARRQEKERPGMPRRLVMLYLLRTAPAWSAEAVSPDLAARARPTARAPRRKA
jgi:hypothetical protein